MKKIATILYPFEQIESIVEYSLDLAQTFELQPVFVSVTDAEETVSEADSPDPAASFDRSVVEQDRKKILRRILMGYGFDARFVDRIIGSFVCGTVQKVSGAINRTPEVDFVFLPRTGSPRFQYTAANFFSLVGKPIAVFQLSVDFHTLKTILYLANLEEKDVQYLKYLAMLATHIRASITVCHLRGHHGNEPELSLSGYQELLKSRINFLNIQILEEKSDLNGSSPVEFYRKYKADMLVIPGDDFGLFLDRIGIGTPEAFLAKSPLPFAILAGYPPEAECD